MPYPTDQGSPSMPMDVPIKHPHHARSSRVAPGLTLRLTLGGLDLPVVALRLREGLSRITRMEVDVIHSGPACLERLGSSARLMLSAAPGPVRDWQGILMACRPSGMAEDVGRRWRLSLRSRLAGLTLHRHTRLFTGLDAVDLARELLEPLGVAVDAGHLTLDHPRRGAILQADESDADLLFRVLARAGIHTRLAAVEGMETLRLADGMDASEPRVLDWLGPSRGWGDRAPGVLSAREHHRQVCRQIRVRGRLADGRPCETLADTGHGEGIQDHPGWGLHDSRSLEWRARFLAQREACRARTLLLETTVPDLEPGERVRISAPDHPSVPSGVWRVESVLHRVHSDASGRWAYRNRVRLCPGDASYRPAEPRRHGAVPDMLQARIQGLNGPDQDEAGRQRARGLFEDAGLMEPDRGPRWARLTPYAAPPGQDGQASGWHAPLHPGQPVSLMILGGDPDGFAVIAGAGFDGAHANPVNARDDTANRYRSAGGHTLLMDDREGRALLRLFTRDEQHLLALDAHADAATLSLICRQGALIATTGGCLHIRCGGDLDARAGGDRHERVAGESSVQVAGPCLHGAAADWRGRARRHVAMVSEGGLQASAARGLNLSSGDRVVLEVVAGDGRWQVEGDVSLWADRDLHIRSRGGHPIVIGTPEAGITLLPARGVVILHGRAIHLAGPAVHLRGRVEHHLSGGR
ncbi:phage late control D family protein [Ectothiorhodospira sp. BSL-9]|uniref:phage late control D family protein n=1 Tax=Ectothiorhodospira sp. BSL-9 TaxID=1442136 RepID=UPI00143B8B50|nr:phage late control D family protein [Ectothiorhodospira sp. BSL-9]